MKRSHCVRVLAGLGMLILILDTKTALSGALEGITMCLKTLIPSLLPFFFLSMLLTSSIVSARFLSPLCRLLRLPEAAASVLAVGILGGYPVGAQCTAQAVREGRISRENGRRMLSFCSNAGPAFLFGMGSQIFPKLWMCWVLWAIHILSALLVGILTPGEADASVGSDDEHGLTLTEAMTQSIKTMAMVCGWVILFRVILAFCHRWFLWLLPKWAQILFTGLLELANGCCSLVLIENTQLRFILFSLLLGFGGLCVTMQTFGVTEGVDASLYLPGKITQAFLSAGFAALIVSREIAGISLVLLAVTCALYYFFCRKGQKKLAFGKPVMYNKKKYI